MRGTLKMFVVTNSPRLRRANRSVLGQHSPILLKPSGEGEPAPWRGDRTAEFLGSFDPFLNDDLNVGECFLVGLSVRGAAGGRMLRFLKRAGFAFRRYPKVSAVHSNTSTEACGRRTLPKGTLIARTWARTRRLVAVFFVAVADCVMVHGTQVVLVDCRADCPS